MTKGNKTAVYVVSGILVAVAAYFVIRGIAFGKEARAKKKEIEEGRVEGEEPKSPVRQVVDPIGIAAEKAGAAVGSAISGLFGGASATPKTVVTKSGTNLRPEASTIKPALRQYKAGTTLTVTGSKNSGGFTWFSVTEGANKGWVRSDAVNIA